MKNRKLLIFAGFCLSVSCIAYGLILSAAAAVPQHRPTTEKVEIIKNLSAPAAVIQQEEQTPPPVNTILGLSESLEAHINETAELYGLAPDLIRAVIYVESRGQIDADNGLCYGLMQLNKTYTETFTIGAAVDNITDPENNILAGCWHLAELLEWADGNEDLALMAYNLGQSKARRYWAEGRHTTTYSENVQKAREQFVYTAM